MLKKLAAFATLMFSSMAQAGIQLDKSLSFQLSLFNETNSSSTNDYDVKINLIKPLHHMKPDSPYYPDYMIYKVLQTALESLIEKTFLQDGKCGAKDSTYGSSNQHLFVIAKQWPVGNCNQTYSSFLRSNNATLFAKKTLLEAQLYPPITKELLKNQPNFLCAMAHINSAVQNAYEQCLKSSEAEAKQQSIGLNNLMLSGISIASLFIVYITGSQIHSYYHRHKKTLLTDKEIKTYGALEEGRPVYGLSRISE